MVRDSATKNPIPWASLTALKIPGTAFIHATRDQNGRFSLGTVPQPHVLIVEADGYQMRSVPVGGTWFFLNLAAPGSRDIELLPR